MRNNLRKIFYFKMKEINLKNNKNVWDKIPNKTKENEITKWNFLVINKNVKGEGRGQSSWFSNGLWKVNFTRDYQSNKLFKLKSNKLTRYPLRIKNQYPRNMSI